MAAPRDCPCHSGERYKSCCGPLHAGKRTAATPLALMRSRYAAFALGLGRYLVDTLSASHPDRPHPDLERELARSKERQRYLGLRIVHAQDDEVLFVAKIFERGVDRSFAELSTFVREHGEWRYASGIAVPRSALPKDVDALDRTTFLAVATGRESG